MKVVTLRNLPPEVARMIQNRASQRGTSITKAVIELLAERAGVAKKPQPTLHDDLDRLAGSWSREEGAAFDRALAEQRSIDADVWQ